MQMKRLRGGWRMRWMGRTAALAAIVAGAVASPSSGSGYGLNWHATVSGGVARARNPCFHLSGSVAQPTVTPGVISNPSGAQYMLFSGFWSAAPIAGRDEIFFDGFEDCKS